MGRRFYLFARPAVDAGEHHPPQRPKRPEGTVLSRGGAIEPDGEFLSLCVACRSVDSVPEGRCGPFAPGEGAPSTPRLVRVTIQHLSFAQRAAGHAQSPVGRWRLSGLEGGILAGLARMPASAADSLIALVWAWSCRSGYAGFICSAAVPEPIAGAQATAVPRIFGSIPDQPPRSRILLNLMRRADE